MDFLHLYSYEKSRIPDNKILLGSVLLSALYFSILTFSGFSTFSCAALFGLPFLLIFIFNTDIIIIVSVLLLFVFVNVTYYQVVVLSAIPVGLSFIVTHKGKIANDVKSPIMIPLIFFLLTMVPSILNITDYHQWILTIFNLVFMIIMLCIVGSYITKYSQIKLYLIAFIIASVCNGLMVIYNGHSTVRRVFGYTGVVYVDYACIAIVICLIIILFYRSIRTIPLMIAIVILFISFLLTQTRNPLISLGASFTFLIIFLFKNNVAFSISRKKLLLTCMLGMALTIILLAIMNVVTPQAFGRINELLGSKSGHIANTADISQNSLFSRLLIWHTSIMAFIRHPFIGIGAYAFPFESYNYATIPNSLYIFVQGMSPHVTYLAVLTETGIIGFIGFIMFLFATTVMAIKSVKYSVSKQHKYYSLGILTVQIYILVSMMLSDAWRWGQCGMLWSLVMGVSVANYKIIMREKIHFEN